MAIYILQRTAMLLDDKNAAPNASGVRGKRKKERGIARQSETEQGGERERDREGWVGSLSIQVCSRSHISCCCVTQEAYLLPSTAAQSLQGLIPVRLSSAFSLSL